MSRERCDGQPRSAGRIRLIVAGLALLLVPGLARAQSVPDKYQRMREKQSQFNLTSSPTTVLRVNKFQCGLRNQGDTCSDVFNSPTGGGGFWPTGTPDQYMFNSGIQVVGIIPASAGFTWAGDTVGAFFMDASGLRAHGTPLTEIYDSQNPEDLANWPDKGTFPDFPDASAYVSDTSLFNNVLIGRKAASQQDSWVMYWDGDPGPTGGRDHPMGITVEQRTLAWNYPQGNEAIIYILYKFTNVTNSPLFQRLNETKFFGGQNQLPDAGWSFDSIYVAYDSDPDVTHDFDKNYATAILPFNLGLAYEATFFEPEFVYPPTEFFPPFFTSAPGLVGIKYLKSPIDPATGEEVGLTSFSLHTNGDPFNDPRTVQQGWRYISLNIDAGKGDPPCTFDVSEIKARRSCFLSQTQADVRFFIGSGPFSLGPGESSTIAVAMFAAATVNTPQIQTGSSADNKPGFPSIQPGCAGNPIRPLEAAAGWIRTTTCPAGATETVNQFDVDFVPGSLLGKALVAQSIFDNKFLLGFAPESPAFSLVPGDNQVTVVWEPTTTEQSGDPFFSAAGDPDNPLFDPNYRQFDVEGYRIYRGTTPANLALVAQFDKKGSVFTDKLCVTDPEFVVGDECTEESEMDIVSPFVQYPPGGVVRLADGTTLVVAADTALAASIEAGTSKPLTDTGIPFAYVDKAVRNGFQYFYKVTAFDINSLKSGPSSLESASASKAVTARKSATSLTDAQYTIALFGRGDTPLEGAPLVIDPVTGEFGGPPPPTDELSGSFLPFAPQLLPAGTYEVRIDSVLPEYYGGAYYISVSGEGQTLLELSGDAITGDPAEESYELPVISVPADEATRQELLAKGVDAPVASGSFTTTISFDRLHWHSGDSDWAFEQPGFWEVSPPNTVDGGSRWFNGDAESTPDPTLGKFTAGKLEGITTIFKPVPYADMADYDGNASSLMRRFYQATWGVRRAADMKVYWSAAGVDSVIDVTHHVPVAFSTHARATYGFMIDADGDGVLTWGDTWHIAGFEDIPTIGGYAADQPGPLTPQPTVTQVDVTGDLVPDGEGFALYIAGEPYYFLGVVPTSGVWTLRTYNGAVTHENGTYAFSPTGETPAVPGLRFALTVQAPAQIVAAEADLSNVHTVPDPYYANSLFDFSPATKSLHFVNLPAQATIRIYSMSGVLVNIVNHDDPAAGGVATWNLTNRGGQFVASGVYFFHVSTPDGKSRVGKFTIINSTFAR